MNLARSLPFAFALAVSLVAACDGSEVAGTAGGGGSGGAGGEGGAPVDPLTLDPTQPGAYTCGHRELSMTYTPPAGLPARTIPVHVWYPSRATDGYHPKYVGIFEDEQAFEGVPLAMPAWELGTLPVLVHSHGYKGFAGNSARLMCHFASHGWLAVAPEHVGNLLGDTPPKLPLSVFVHRPFDVRAALDFVAALPSEDPLAGKVDLGHVAMSGHSFGTFTAWAIGGAKLDPDSFQAKCASGDVTDCTDEALGVLAADVSDPRAKIVIPMAGAPNDDVAPGGYDSANVPVLMMSGSLNPVGDDEVWAGTTKVDLTWVDVEGGCHQLFGLGNTLLGDVGCAVLPDEEGFALVNPLVLAYARHRVLGDDSAKVKGLAEGTESISPKVHVQHKTGAP